MCMNPELRATLTYKLNDIQTQISAEVSRMHETATGGMTDKLRSLCKMEEEIENEISAIGHQFAVGDGAHSSFNGGRRPYQVVSVSKSKKTITVVGMGHRAIKPADGSETPHGQNDWEVYPLEYVEGETASATYTLRKNGYWIRKGCGLNDTFMAMYPGACYSNNYEF